MENIKCNKEEWKKKNLRYNAINRIDPVDAAQNKFVEFGETIHQVLTHIPLLMEVYSCKLPNNLS